jgi:hypothetical protein
MKFKDYVTPAGHTYKIPTDIDLSAPKESSLMGEALDKLIYIPWDDKYLERIPGEYKDFFMFVLPHLKVRTTDVHVAACMPYLEKLIASFSDGLDERIIYIALILHDIGWSKLSEAEVASSLGVDGLTLSSEAMGPKEKHAVVGQEIAKEILSSYKFADPLRDSQEELILDAVLFHDKPWELAKGGDIPLEVKLVCDADHLWSFTHENFWQDTSRKGVEPQRYLENLKKDLEGYFVTDEAKQIARVLLSERAQEASLLN